MHLILHPKYARPNSPTARAGTTSNTNNSIAIEIELLTSQSLLICWLATWAKPIRYTQQKPDIRTNKVIPHPTRQRLIFYVSFRTDFSCSGVVTYFAFLMSLAGERKERATKRRGGIAKRVQNKATQKSATKPSQKRGSSSSYSDVLRLKNRAHRLN